MTSTRGWRPDQLRFYDNELPEYGPESPKFMKSSCLFMTALIVTWKQLSYCASVAEHWSLEWNNLGSNLRWDTNSVFSSFGWLHKHDFLAFSLPHKLFPVFSSPREFLHLSVEYNFILTDSFWVRHKSSCAVDDQEHISWQWHPSPILHSGS